MLRMNPLEQKKTCFTPTYCQIYHDSCTFFFAKQMRNAAMMITVEDDSGKNIATAI